MCERQRKEMSDSSFNEKENIESIHHANQREKRKEGNAKHNRKKLDKGRIEENEPIPNERNERCKRETKKTVVGAKNPKNGS